MRSPDNARSAHLTYRQVILSIGGIIAVAASTNFAYMAVTPFCLAAIWVPGSWILRCYIKRLALLLWLFLMGWLVSLDIAAGVLTGLIPLLLVSPRYPNARRAHSGIALAAAVTFCLFCMVSGAFGASLLLPMMASSARETLEPIQVSYALRVAGIACSALVVGGIAAGFFLKRSDFRVVAVAASLAVLSLTWGDIGVSLLAVAHLGLAIVAGQTSDDSRRAPEDASFALHLAALAAGLILAAVLGLSVIEYHVPADFGGASLTNASLRSELTCTYRWRTQGQALEEELLFERFPERMDRFESERRSFEQRGEFHAVESLANLMPELEPNAVQALALRCERTRLAPAHQAHVVEAFEWIVYPDGPNTASADLGRETIFTPAR